MQTKFYYGSKWLKIGTADVRTSVTQFTRQTEMSTYGLIYISDFIIDQYG